MVTVALMLPAAGRALAGRVDPRAADPRALLEAAERLAEAGIAVEVVWTPVVPGVNELRADTTLGSLSRRSSDVVHDKALALSFFRKYEAKHSSRENSIEPCGDALELEPRKRENPPRHAHRSLHSLSR